MTVTEAVLPVAAICMAVAQRVINRLADGVHKSHTLA